MPQPKPENHVTRALALHVAPAHEWPEVPEEVVEYMERIYPPRCFTGAPENLEHHLMYAGVVGFIADLRSVVEEQQRVLYAEEHSGDDPGVEIERS